MKITYEVNNTMIFVADSDPEYKSNVGLRKKNIVTYFDSSDSSKWFKTTLAQSEDIDKYMVISHAHQDHYNGMLKEAFQFKKIFCGRTMAEILLFNGFLRENLVIINQKNSSLDIDGALLIHCKHCHTQSDICFIDMDNKIAFLGDLYLQNRHPLIEKNHLSNLYVALEKVFSMDINMFIPGHGLPSNRTEFKKYLDYLKFLINASTQCYSKSYILNWMYEHSCIEWKNEENL